MSMTLRRVFNENIEDEIPFIKCGLLFSLLP